MFINCPHCRALVATDPATDLPPPRCPRCAAQLRDEVLATPVPVEAVTPPAGGPDDDVAVVPAAADLAVTASAPDYAAHGDAAASEPAPTDATRSDPARSAPVDPALVASPADGDAALPGAVTDPALDAAPTTSPGGFAFARLLRRRAVADAPAGPAVSTVPAPPAAPAAPPNTIASATAAAADVEGTPLPTLSVRDLPPRRIYAVVPMPGAGRDATVLPRTTWRVSMPEGLPPHAEHAPPARMPDGTSTAAATAVPTATPTPRPAAAPDPRHAPSFVRGRAAAAPASRRQQWTLAAAIVGLSLLLAVQWVVADREPLAADARWRPLVQHVCAALRCTLPPWREPSALVLLDRDVRPDPAIPDALRVTASFRNDAPWPQAWPLLQLTLSDVDGMVVAEGAFAAGDYLGAVPSQPMLAPGQVATVRMVVAEPTPHSVAFAFAFR